MRKLLNAFYADERGAITVDFVVLTGAICLLGFFAVQSIGSGTTDLSNRIEAKVDGVEL